VWPLIVPIFSALVSTASFALLSIDPPASLPFAHRFTAGATSTLLAGALFGAALAYFARERPLLVWLVFLAATILGAFAFWPLADDSLFERFSWLTGQLEPATWLGLLVAGGTLWTLSLRFRRKFDVVAP
jgi:hypothetical protein